MNIEKPAIPFLASAMKNIQYRCNANVYWKISILASQICFQPLGFVQCQLLRVIVGSIGKRTPGLTQNTVNPSFSNSLA